MKTARKEHLPPVGAAQRERHFLPYHGWKRLVVAYAGLTRVAKG